ncbi:putative Rab-GTPase-TBC domain-containing protein [Helianthus debilis subsp. tardiflorus]
MSPAARIEPNKKTLPESSSSSWGELSPERSYRRFGDLRGVQWRIDLGILPSSSSSIDDFRRVTANCRRSYAALRRRLLISPPISRDERHFRDLVMDNPLSQNPDSMWGQFFHKAELERTVDQDLSRLYPEHGSYFQTPERQGVLRRILLLWCIRHPNYGYRQGMHELLAPLLYVLQADLERLSEVRKLYKDYFTDNFDGLSLNVTDLSYNSDLEKDEDNMGIQKDMVKVHHLNELDPKIQTIISFSDAYGAEGELGIVLSEKFIEHDAYSMFDVLMNGDEGAVAMANFFSQFPSPENGLPPVLEASSALYRLLSTVDFSLYTHLVELGVEPQYFALRWLRVLFGREFALADLLVIWDEIFALDNTKLKKEKEVTFNVFNSLRGAFISALAVSMILYLRSSLLATENATSCLQRLLNFPEDVNLRKLLTKAKSLMNLATDALNSVLEPRGHRHSLSSDQAAHASPRGGVRENYWEEQWRVMNKEAEDRKQAGISKQVRNRIRCWSEKVKARLAKVTRSTSPFRRNLVDDQTAHLEENKKLVSGNCSSEQNSNSNSNINETGSTVESSSSVIGPEPGPGPGPTLSPSTSISSGLYRSTEDVFSPVPTSNTTQYSSFNEVKNDNITKMPVADLGDEQSSPGKFQWLWRFAKSGPEGSLDKSEAATSSDTESKQKNGLPEAVDRNKFKILAQSMFENIKVIESAENLSENALEALKELRKIRNLLSER